MKPVYTLLVLLFLSAMSGCCTRKYCIYPTGVSIVFQGYDKADLDTLLLTGYRSQSDFGEVSVPEFVDSSDKYSGALVPVDDEDTTTRYYYLETDNDWQLVIPATNQSFRFRYYDFEMRKCNTCILAKDLHRSLRSVNVNGKQVEGASYIIQK